MVPHTLSHVSARKLMALAASELDVRFPSSSARGFPSVIQLEPTNLCNLRCPLCASGIKAFTRPTGMMDIEVFKGIIDEIGHSLSLLVLWDWGEPFIHPDIFRMIRYARQRNVAVITSSNGQLIASPDAAREIVASGLDTLAVAMDGACQETYAKYRVGGTLDNVLKCLSNVREAKREANVDHPILNVRVVVTRENESELDEIKRLAEDNGADILTFRSVSMPKYCGENLDSVYAPENPAYQMYQYAGDGLDRVKAPKFSCRRPWKRITINWDGTIVGCEHDYDHTSPFGRYPHDGSVMDIYNSERAREFRGRFLRNKDQYSFCGDCTYNDRVTQDCTVGRMDFRRINP